MFSHLFAILLTESLPQRCCVTPLLILCMHTDASKNNLHKYSIILLLKMKHRVRKRLPRPNKHWHLKIVVFKAQWTDVAQINCPCIGTQLTWPRAPGTLAQDWQMWYKSTGDPSQLTSSWNPDMVPWGYIKQHVDIYGSTTESSLAISQLPMARQCMQGTYPHKFTKWF